ncbi:hypothetical protein QBC47DRAFT_298134 [Echria macrotheca]|uniref:Phospholipid/glycerol acyltransferase domain-containing protein n=1 Tax=Echria macrotheca TaxID=438768 RepID=A0AAJ0BET2_9PEZI|nr:hypothetical protein QBC47DRAFT_298134 [Echria macrotheca]
MEKFSQFRDRGSGVSPFLPSKTPSSILSATPRVFLFLVRLPLFLGFATFYFLLLQHLPLPTVARKLFLWCLLAIPGIWWVDLQLDGVKRGSLSQQPASRVPHPRSVIAANFTSPLDALYLAAVFDPVFTISYPHTRKVRRVGLLGAMWAALSPAQLSLDPPSPENLTDLGALLARYPDRVVAVFPECATTNGKGILPPSPSVLAVPADAVIFPLSMRYTPPDVATPVPGAWAAFLWKLLSRPTHCIRVRIAEGMYNSSVASNGAGHGSSSASSSSSSVTAVERELSSGGSVAAEEQRVLDRVADALARLGRAKRVGLTVADKREFVEAWNKARR